MNVHFTIKAPVGIVTVKV